VVPLPNFLILWPVSGSLVYQFFDDSADLELQRNLHILPDYSLNLQLADYYFLYFEIILAQVQFIDLGFLSSSII
jgi:hypothetical protein